ncbi:hypothetical protein [Maribacter sp. 2304DJ31-5]|uniref:hypothetical protein n=1 Tax=Maribacter sp. 2304DJ31-5 TaxID=3386273 RepID=UPI0039BD3ECF
MNNSNHTLLCRQIYATDANRNFVSSDNIKTDFKRKGRKTKRHDHYRLLAQMITKDWATRLEGSFGTDKEHFLLKRIQQGTRRPRYLDILRNTYLKYAQN